MANSPAYFSQFKQHAFIWKSVFAQRQTKMYESEDGKRCDLSEDPNLGTELVIDKFIYNGCQHDIHRYLYRKILAEFLGTADMEFLRLQSTPQVSLPMVLIDDRNERTPKGESMVGHRRPSKGPLTAHQFYAELLKNVRYALKPTPKHSNMNSSLTCS
jgi:hypothetical protein